MIPKELDDLLKKYDEEDHLLYITRVDFSSENFVIDLDLTINAPYEAKVISQKWTVEAIGHRKNHISFDYSGFVAIETQHPLLWEFTDTQCELYYIGYCENTAQLFYDLYLTHYQFLGRYHQCFSINILFHTEKTYPKLSAYSNGLLTTGPKKLMEKYSECLIKNGLDFNMIGERPAKYWDGQQFITESDDLKILFIGDTFIIARGFEFKSRD